MTAEMLHKSVPDPIPNKCWCKKQAERTVYVDELLLGNLFCLTFCSVEFGLNGMLRSGQVFTNNLLLCYKSTISRLNATNVVSHGLLLSTSIQLNAMQDMHHLRNFIIFLFSSQIAVSIRVATCIFQCYPAEEVIFRHTPCLLLLGNNPENKVSVFWIVEFPSVSRILK